MATTTQTDPVRAAQAKLDNAFESFAHDNGDGFYDRDWLGAIEYRDEGLRIGEAAYLLPEDDRENFIEDEACASPTDARYLIAVAAACRIAEMTQRDAYSFRAEAA